jgi:hypothetical protein
MMISVFVKFLHDDAYILILIRAVYLRFLCTVIKIDYKCFSDRDDEYADLAFYFRFFSQR